MATRHVPAEGFEPWERPAPADRAARSEAIERRIAAAAARIADPGLRRLLEGTLPNTLDTTVTVGGDDARPDTFVVTGDIDAMWLRDSTAQVWPYLASAPDDPDLDRLLRGGIRRQATQVLLDPYANAFLADERDGEWAADDTDMRPGVHERKWEPDSLSAFCRLSAGYADATGSVRPFDGEWRGALETALRTLRAEQRLGGSTTYRFRRPDGDPLDVVANAGRGAPTTPNGMVHGAFRPSDDRCELPLSVPINLALAAALEAVAPLAASVDASASATDARALAAEIRAAVDRDGVVDEDGAPRWAYEIDGRGGRVLMDDANAPSLLSLPYLGYCAPDDPIYLNTRRWILSDENPYFYRGAAAAGIGSPHTPPRYVWPIALAVQGLTSLDRAEQTHILETLERTDAGAFLMHEGFHADDPTQFTRPWFAWANAMFSEFVLAYCFLIPLSDKKSRNMVD
jgi:meiotically up-regulated gene 157 (Mug157) protein